MSKWISLFTAFVCIAANAQQVPLSKRTINVFTTAESTGEKISKTVSGKAFCH
ncbi:hypothetical protein [Niabella hibiscisoli]|uniref:hypothetical protein n=1 Tax=Niabella hibiscisoli TaxID=1825928 RepID=UPI001F0FB41E|nr:hypothetical protein [Niabella hibiscisoli]MCH5719642.1 hypothetical protein [Niabella hibiscisoli]